MGGFCVLKRRNFEFDRLENRRKKGKKQTSSEAQTNAQKLSKREVKREITLMTAETASSLISEESLTMGLSFLDHQEMKRTTMEAEA